MLGKLMQAIPAIQVSRAEPQRVPLSEFPVLSEAVTLPVTRCHATCIHNAR